MLRDDINISLKDAMKTQDKRRLGTLRLVNAAIKDRDIEARGHGKDPLSDFREGKQTAIIACARTTPQWPLIERELGRPDLSAAGARRIRSLLIDCGAKDRVEALRDAALAYVHSACADDPRLVPDAIVHVLRDFTSQLEGRRS